MKNNGVLKVINVILVIYILTLTVGYAFFSESLTINGVATTVDFYSGTNLPTEPIIRDTEYNRYYSYDVHKDYVDFDSETWEGDTYTLNYEKKFGLVVGERTVNYVVSFTNPTVLDYTNGEVTTEIVQNDNSRIKEVSASISKTELAPGETVDVTFTVKFNFLTQAGNHSVKATVAYTFQGQPRYFYFIINYN